MKGKASRGNKITNGDYGLVALEPAWITSNQIEAARIAMTRYTKRGGQVWIKIFPDKPITEKPAETRMGSGKGSPEYWVAVVKPGRVMFEMNGVSEEIAREDLWRPWKSPFPPVPLWNPSSTTWRIVSAHWGFLPESPWNTGIGIPVGLSVTDLRCKAYISIHGRHCLIAMPECSASMRDWSVDCL